jgi:hypothetical protein
MINPSGSDSLIEVNERRGFNPTERGGLVWYTDGSKTKKALELGSIAMEQGGNLVLALGNRQQYFRQKYTSLRHVQSRI